MNDTLRMIGTVIVSIILIRYLASWSKRLDNEYLSNYFECRF